MKAKTYAIYKKLSYFIQSEIALLLSTVAAGITMFFVPPSVSYLAYIDFKVLSLLFCLMAVVSGLINANVFDVISAALLKKASTVRIIAFILINCSFFFSMFVTNDVALITLIPISIGLFKEKQGKYLIFTIILETVAANLGSMLTPIGNPQNLYLFSYYELSLSTFWQTIFPVGLLSYILITALLLLIPKTEILMVKSLNIKSTPPMPPIMIKKTRTALYVLLLSFCITTVLGVFDYRICLILILLAILCTDRLILLKIDYSLLLTFVMFFIFSGNLSHIPAVYNFLSHIINEREFIVSIAASQIISNVPAAVMLSGFTSNASDLLRGVNVGGLGTLIASLASLISFRIYARSEQAQKGLYISAFTVVNIFMLIILISFCFILYK